MRGEPTVVLRSDMTWPSPFKTRSDLVNPTRGGAGPSSRRVPMARQPDRQKRLDPPEYRRALTRGFEEQRDERSDRYVPGRDPAGPFRAATASRRDLCAAG